MTAKPKAAGWLAENGPKELELLFRAFVFNPSAPILLVDDDRGCLKASIGAGKLLGLPLAVYPSPSMARDSVRLRRPGWTNAYPRSSARDVVAPGFNNPVEDNLRDY